MKSALIPPAVAEFQEALKSAEAITLQSGITRALEIQIGELELAIQNAPTDEEAMKFAHDLATKKAELSVRQLRADRLKSEIQDAWAKAVKLVPAAESEVLSVTSPIRERAIAAVESLALPLVSSSLRDAEFYSGGQRRETAISGLVGVSRVVNECPTAINQPGNEGAALCRSSSALFSDILSRIPAWESEVVLLESAAAAVKAVFNSTSKPS